MDYFVLPESNLSDDLTLDNQTFKSKFMNKTAVLIVGLIFLSFFACKKHNNEINIDSIINTHWILHQVVDLNTNETTNFPSKVDNFEIIFRKDGIIEFINLCNNRSMIYSLEDNNSIETIPFGITTQLLCSPKEFSDWECLFIECMIDAETYSISDDNLAIYCQGYALIFKFIAIVES